MTNILKVKGRDEVAEEKADDIKLVSWNEVKKYDLVAIYKCGKYKRPIGVKTNRDNLCLIGSTEANGYATGYEWCTPGDCNYKYYILPPDALTAILDPDKVHESLRKELLKKG